ncbi:MAG: hypothetical protein EBV62_08000 [Betaproteobacteria bacterium]|nr:hypothetical protein [Betaproteobacteria bacterium]
MSPKAWRRSLIVLLLTAALIALALWRMEKNKTPEKSDQLPALVFKAGELTQPVSPSRPRQAVSSKASA